MVFQKGWSPKCLHCRILLLDRCSFKSYLFSKELVPCCHIPGTLLLERGNQSEDTLMRFRPKQEASKAQGLQRVRASDLVSIHSLRAGKHS